MSKLAFTVGIFACIAFLLAIAATAGIVNDIEHLEHRLTALEFHQRDIESYFGPDEDALYEQTVREVLRSHSFGITFDQDEMVEQLMQAHHNFPPICLDVD